MTEKSRPWRVRMLDFVAYMRSKGHHYTWLHHGQVARPIGLYALKFHCNDNQRAPRSGPHVSTPIGGE